MFYYAQIGPNGKVHTISQTDNRMVLLEEPDYRLLGCNYDPVTGQFTGYKVTLTADKQYIMADDTDTVRITANIRTWDDQDANDTYTDPILFVVDGTPKLVTKKAEGYYIDYKTTSAGTKSIKTQDDKFIAQGSVSVLAVEVE